MITSRRGTPSCPRLPPIALQRILLVMLVVMGGNYLVSAVARNKFLASAFVRRFNVRGLSPRIPNPRHSSLAQSYGQNPSSSALTLEIPTAEDTEEVGALFSAMVLQNLHTQQGSTIFLDGDLGAGKTAFARGFLRAATGDVDLRVTSPTYLLVNVYPVGGKEVHHMDLYRLAGDPEDFVPLNLQHVFENCVSLIEWPQRLKGVPIPEDRLDVNIRIQSDSVGKSVKEKDGEDDNTRIMTINPRGPVWEEILQSIKTEGYLDDLLV